MKIKPSVYRLWIEDQTTGAEVDIWIGSTVRPLAVRFGEHLSKAKLSPRTTPILQKIREAGTTHINYSLVSQHNSESAARRAEVREIKRSSADLYNVHHKKR